MRFFSGLHFLLLRHREICFFTHCFPVFYSSLQTRSKGSLLKSEAESGRELTFLILFLCQTLY